MTEVEGFYVCVCVVGNDEVMLSLTVIQMSPITKYFAVSLSIFPQYRRINSAAVYVTAPAPI